MRPSASEGLVQHLLSKTGRVASAMPMGAYFAQDDQTTFAITAGFPFFLAGCRIEVDEDRFIEAVEVALVVDRSGKVVFIVLFFHISTVVVRSSPAISCTSAPPTP